MAASGAFKSACAWGTESQFPTRTPFIFTPLMRVMPAASSGASSPLSAASTASLRTAVIRTLIEIDPSPRASSDTRHALTVGFRGTCYRAANWVLLGKTAGRGKQSNSYVPNRSIKEVLGYPLTRQFRQLLGETEGCSHA